LQSDLSVRVIMRNVYPVTGIVAALSVLVPSIALAQTPPSLSITNYQLVSEQRISRTESYVTYKADLVNTGPARTAVTATATGTVPSAQVVAGQGNLHFAPVPANSQVTSSNTFTLLVDRTVTFSFSSLVWTFTAPVANAGPNQTAKIGKPVILDGGGSSNPSGIGTLTYSWTFKSRPPGSSVVLQNATAAISTFTPDVLGDYILTLTVSNGAGSDSASVTVSTSNSPPVATAGPNQTVAVGATVTLNGSGSSDVDGDPLTYSWTLISKPAASTAALIGPTTVSPTFIADAPGTYIVQLVVNDGKVNSTPSTVTITTQNTPPVANAGANQSVSVGALVQLNGSASTDVDGDPLTYKWSFISRPAGSTATLSNPSIVNPTFTADVAGTYTVQLIVNDGKVDSAAALVTITTNTILAPTANAGSNQTVVHGTTVQLNGSGTDPQGLTLTFQWSFTMKPSGSAAAFSSSTIPNPTFLADIPGTYVAQLIVSNGTRQSQPATVTITNTNTPPVANAGSNQTVAVGATVTLDGTGSTDADSDPLTYSWSFNSKPAGSSATIIPATSAEPTFLVDLPGTYIAQLIVSDGFASSNPPATVTITAGSNIITLSPNPLNLSTVAAGTLTVAVGSPAGPSGIAVNLVSQDTSVVTVQPTVVIAPNSSSASVTVTPTGNVGSTGILATANGFSPALATVVVSVPSITVTLPSSVGLARSINGTVTLSGPASAGGVSVQLAGAPAGIVTLQPTTLTIPAGSTTGSFTVTGADVGSATITASSAGYNSGSSNVTVGKLGQIILPANITVGPGQSVPFPISLATPAPVGGATITLTSSDPGKVTIPATVFIPELATTPAVQPQVTGVSLGSATITASSPGFDGDSQTVLVAAALSFNPTSLTLGTGATQNLTLNLSSSAPAGGIVINLSSTNPAIASVPATVTIAANTSSVLVPVTAGNTTGPAVIHASSLPALPDTTASITVVTLGTIGVPSNVSAPLGGSTPLLITLSSQAPAGGVTLNLTTSDPSKITVIPASVVVPAGQTSPGSAPQLNGTDLGTASVTVSATGYTSGTTTVQVGATLAFTPPGLTIGGFATQNLTLTLSGAAPAGGLTVNLSSSDTTVAQVGSTATFAGGSKTVLVPVTGVGVGSATIHASALPNLADTTAAVTVQSGGGVILPSATIVGLSLSTPLPVTLSAPAPAGGVTVTLSSSDPSKAAVSPATVTIAGGQTTPASQPQVTGINLGSATITASASGYAPGSGAVQVNASLVFAPPSLTVGPGATQNLTLTLSATAPTGLTVNLTSSDTTVATVPVTATIAPGSNTASVPVTGVAVGNAVIHASALPNVPDTTASVSVQSGIVLPAISVGLGSFTQFPVTLASPAPPGGVFITLSSSDTAKVTISPSTLMIPEGQTASAVTPTVTGVGFPSATISASATGFGTASQVVQVTAALQFFPAGLTFSGPGTQNITLNLSANAPAGGLTITLSSSNSGVATVPASVTIPANVASTTVQVTANGVGTATITATSGLSNVANATASVTVTAPGAISLPSNATVQLGQSAPYPISLGTPAPPGGVTVTLVSSDTSKLTISSSVFIAENTTTPATQPQITGIDVGAVTISASAQGYTPATANASVIATMAFQEQTLSIVGTTVGMLHLALSAAAPPQGIQVFLSSSDTNIATVPATFTFFPDGSSRTTLQIPVTGVNPGTVVIRATSSQFVPDATANVTVLSPGAIQLPSNVTIGPGQSAAFPVTLGTPAPTGGVTVTLSSSDSSKVAINPATVSIAAGDISPAVQPQVTGGNLGTATISASAPGYTGASAPVHVAATLSFSPATVSITGAATQDVTLKISPAAPPSGVTINLSSSDTTVATVPATVSIAPNANSATVTITGIASGSATIHASALPDVPDATANVTVQSAGSIQVANVNLELSKSADLAVTLPSPAPAGGVTVTLVSSDPSKVTVSPTVSIAAGQTTPASPAQVTGVDFGTTTITASAPGYTGGNGSVQVTASLTYSPTSLTISGTATQAFTLTLSDPAPGGGLTVNVSSSNTAVATVPATVTFAAGATTASLPVTGVAPGTAVIHAGASPNVPDATANVTVTPPGAIVVPSNTSVGLGSSANFAVTLSSPAPAGGVTITLSSSDTSKVTISPGTVTIAGGETAPASPPQVNGVNLGNATINATASGFTGASGTVQVSATISLTPQNLTITGVAPQNLTLTLSAAASAGGLTFNLTSSNTSVATVPASVTIAAGQPSATVTVTPVAPGSTTITASSTAPNIANATDTVTVQNVGNIVLPGSINLPLGGSAPLNVTLSAPAPAGGVTITLSSSDTSKATVPASVTIAQGQTAPSQQPQVAAVNLGSATISASTPGFGGASVPVQVSATVAFNPASLGVTAGTSQNATLVLSAAAPAGGVTVNLSSSNTGVATVPASVTFSPGATSVSVPVTGVAVGSATIHASGSNIPDNTLSVTVTPQAIGSLAIPSASIGRNLQIQIAVTLSVPAPAGGVQVQLTSGDSNKLVLSPSLTAQGSGSITVPIAEGTTTSGGIVLQALADSGSVTVMAVAANFTSAAGTFTLTPSGFILVGPNGIGVPSFTVGQNTNTTLTVFPARLDSSLNFVETQEMGAGVTASVDISVDSANPLGTITGTPLVFTGGMDSATTQFKANSPGQTTVSASVPAGFSQPGQSANVLTVSITPAVIIPLSVTVGQGLEKNANIQLNGVAPTGGLVVTLTSNDPSKVLFSRDGTLAGSTSINVQIQEGHNQSPDFFVYGLASSGTVSCGMSASGFGSATGTITLQRAGIVIQGPGSLGTPIFTSVSGGQQSVTVSSAMLDGTGTVVELQAIAGGSSASVGVTSSNTTVGTITTSPVTIAGGSVSANTAFQPLAVGNTTLTPIQPSGFVTPAQFGSVAVTVSNNNIGLTDVSLGQNLQTQLSVFISSPAPAGGLPVTLTSNNTGALRVSASATTLGNGPITVTIPQGQTSANYYLQALSGSGTVTYTATAPGFQSRTATVPLTPSGIVVLGPLGTSLPFFATSLSAGGTTQLLVTAARLDPSTNAYVETQQLVAGQSLNITLNTTPGGIGTVVSPVTLTGGNDTVVSQFTPTAVGQTVISVNQPGGFTTPSSFASVTAIVNQ
jgi:trimeric autotransporter adhesin